MSTPQSIEDIIASALALPVEQRLAVMDAIHLSLADSLIDHGPAEDAENFTDRFPAKCFSGSFLSSA